MFTLLAILCIFSAFTIGVAGALSLLRNPAKKEHLWFFLFTLFLSVWLPANFFDSNIIKHNVTIPFLYIDYALAIFIAWFLLQFVAALASSLNLKNRAISVAQSRSFIVLTGLFNAGLTVALLTDLLVKASIRNGELIIVTKPLFNLYGLVIVFYFVYALALLLSTYRNTRHGRHQGLDIIGTGFFIAILGNILTNLVFPELIPNQSLVKELNIIGYVSVLILVGCIYIAITVRKLFDIRLVIARSLAYILLISFVGVVYAGITTLASILITGTRVNTLTVVTGLVLTFFAAITFEYVRNFFNKVTRRVFFRQSYDTQAILNELNIITTNTIDLTTLVKKAVILFEENVKSKSCVFVLVVDEDRFRVFGQTTKSDQIKAHSHHIYKSLKPHTPLVLQDLNDGEANRSYMAKLDAEIIIPLFVNNSFIGYILFDTKLNGVAYNQQDLQMLTIAADSLSVAIQNALRFEEIEKFNITLQKRIDEATHKLRRANEKLKSLDETKDDFISMASHQLRTPLTSVKGYLSMVLEEDAGKINSKQKEMLGQAFSSSQRMVYLIADLLNVSRLKTGKFIIEKTPINLANVIEQELAQLDEVAKARSLDLRYDKPKQFPDLMIDDTKTRQVIMNFVDNAIYYTPAGGQINVKLIEKPSTIELRVEDNGIGVPKVEQHHLFTKFFRAGNARKARPDGTGLGLFMAKKVVVSQGGSIIFESKEGKGSTFGFIFSKAKLSVTGSTSVKSPVSDQSGTSATNK